ncbi:acyl carrier protein [Saccharothrix ecbatanensis]|uniref:Acyl carrier protein n=1 Tax=Saccharothrix ecbatanensis TaxID=1105145 RepID=A0A7W9HJK0_9PSEU|nr:acyl carrier protein [Saccharothrix ecbatanensis]MBB5803251.1 acyl carrier protein [Saccharothrix ecbatanensis]
MSVPVRPQHEAHLEVTVSIPDIDVPLRDDIRAVVADILEIDAADIGWTTGFRGEHGADSLTAIEILSALERRFGITIDQDLLSTMTDLSNTYAVIVEAVGKR